MIRRQKPPDPGIPVRMPMVGERVYWEASSPDIPRQYGDVAMVLPTPLPNAFRIEVNWDVIDGEDRHRTMHHFDANSFVKFSEKETAQ